MCWTVFSVSICEVNFSLFLCLTAMETEVPKVPAKKKEPSKRATAAQKKKPLATVSEISDDDDDDDYNDINEIDDDDDDDDDEDSEIEVVATPEARKKGGGKLAANAQAVKAPAAAKKRGAANKQQPQTLGQKLLTDMLKPAENSGISPEKKVRKMRASPFNKKSGSVLGRVGKVNEVTEMKKIWVLLLLLPVLKKLLKLHQQEQDLKG